MSTSAEIMLEPIGPRLRVGGRGRVFTDAELLEAIARHGRNTIAIAEELCVSTDAVNRHRRRLGCPAPKGQPKRPIGDEGVVMAFQSGITWTADNRVKLAALVALRPALSKQDIATAMGTSATAIATAISRFGFSRIGSSETQQMRACMCCAQTFLSEWLGNRLCVVCNEEA